MQELDHSGTPFNMAMLFYYELHELRKLKSRAYIMGDLNTYRDCLEEIYSAVSFKLKDKQKKDLEAIFQTAGLLLEQENRNAKNELRKADMLLIKSMNAYNMIFPKIKVRGLKELEKRYKLT